MPDRLAPPEILEQFEKAMDLQKVTEVERILADYPGCVTQHLKHIGVLTNLFLYPYVQMRLQVSQESYDKACSEGKKQVVLNAKLKLIEHWERMIPKARDASVRYAIDQGDTDFLVTLNELGANPAQRFADGSSPLDYAKDKSEEVQGWLLIASMTMDTSAAERSMFALEQAEQKLERLNSVYLQERSEILEDGLQRMAIT